MSKIVLLRTLYGMFGEATDPGELQFTERAVAALKALPGITVDAGRSPYRDYEVNVIAADINAAPAGTINYVGGSSLGCNNGPVVAAYCPHRIIHGLWGFQASLYGAQVAIGTNVLFAHEAMNPNWFETFGLGAYRWVRAPGNSKTRLLITETHDLHPGDFNAGVQDTFIAEMKRIAGA
jgi:hypothetical protein